MRRLRGFHEPDAYRGCAVAIGNFDGVHRGHQAMIRRLRELADEHAAPAVVLTFDPHPITILRPGNAPPRLSTLDRKQELLERHGVDCTIAVPTSRELLQLEPEEFFQQIVLTKLQAAGLVEGPNFYFGRDRRGDVTLLRSLCDSFGLFLDVVPPMAVDGTMVSSSLIRDLVSRGELRRAVQFLGHPYQLHGVVSTGAGRGAELGFPTANVTGVKTLLPADGVYAARARASDAWHPAAVHLGPNPTFADGDRKLEVHLLDFAGDLYNQEIWIDLHAEVRPIQRFPSAQDLVAQLRQDVETVRMLVSQLPTD